MATRPALPWVVLRLPDLSEIERAVAEAPVQFPYIPGLLSFREAPVVLQALARLEAAPDVLLFDGQGYAHPRRLGLASHVGLLLDWPTAGCAKSRLCGQAGEPAAERGGRAPLRTAARRSGRAAHAHGGAPGVRLRRPRHQPGKRRGPGAGLRRGLPATRAHTPSPSGGVGGVSRAARQRRAEGPMAGAGTASPARIEKRNMNKHYRKWIVMLMIISALAKGLFGHSPQAAAQAVGFEGDVRNLATGEPIVDAEIAAGGVAAMSDARGHYRLPVAPGTYTISARADGYIAMEHTRQILAEGMVATLDFEMLPAMAGAEEQAAIDAQLAGMLQAPEPDPADLLSAAAGVQAVTVVPETLRVLLPDGTVQVMEMDEYLKCVVPREISPAWPAQALRAQAVAARSYAATRHAHADQGADVCTTTHCQVWGSTHYATTDAAVEETSGVAAWYNGSVIYAYFHAQCNRPTKHVAPVWSGGHTGAGQPGLQLRGYPQALLHRHHCQRLAARRPLGTLALGRERRHAHLLYLRDHLRQLQRHAAGRGPGHRGRAQLRHGARLRRRRRAVGLPRGDAAAGRGTRLPLCL